MLAIGLPGLPVHAQRNLAPPAPGSPEEAARRPQPRPGGLQLRIRRLPDALELVVEGTGPAPQLVQSENGNRWQALLTTSRPTGLRIGPQRLAIPEAGLQMVSFDGNGSTYRLEVSSSPGRPANRPVVSADGENLILTFSTPAQASLQLARPNLTLPGRLPQQDYAPPLQPRAVAPPLGDMAVGTMVIKNRSYLELTGPPVTMTTRGARARDVLMTLARMGGYGFTYVESYEIKDKEKATTGSSSKAGLTGANAGRFSDSGYQSGFRGESQYIGTSETEYVTDKNIALTPSPPVSVYFAKERFDRAFNFVLLAANLQGRVEGRSILVGKNVLSQSLSPQISKVYRLNQVDPNSAADYLANLGAKVTKTDTVMTSSGNLENKTNKDNSSQDDSQQESTKSTVNSYGASQGPLLGLGATTDTRLRTITLVGEQSTVIIAEQYLKQLDLRQRQVALSVKILDVSLSNEAEISNSFAFRYGNMFIVNNQGELVANFGSLKPPSSEAGGLPGQSTNAPGISPLTGSGAFRLPGEDQPFVDNPRGKTPFRGRPTRSQYGDFYSRPGFGPYRNPGQPGVTNIEPPTPSTTDPVTGEVTPGEPAIYTYKVPGSFRYPSDQLFDFVKAAIESGNTKVLASPTLVIQEGDSRPTDAGSDSSRISTDGQIGRTRNNEGFVRVGTRYVTSYEVRQDVNGNNFCQPVFENAGLTFGARIDTIDDNGFITFSLSPEISAPVGSQNVGNCGAITLIDNRQLDTGRVRVRDGQTLILTGVISETDRQAVTKWPILGDLPLIGQFFRRSSSNRSKNELVILVTPRIINDDQGGVYGYGWQPGTRQSREFMGGQP